MSHRIPSTTGGAFLLAILVAFSPVYAGPAGRRLSVDLESVPAREVFQSFADELGVRLYFDESLSGPLSLRVDNVKVTTALDAACDSLGCTWVIVEGEKPSLRVLRSRTEDSRGRGQVTDSLVTDRMLQLVSMSLRDAKFGDIMGSFARILRCDLDMKADPSLLLTVEIENVTASQALERIWKLTGSTSSIHWGPVADQCTLRVWSSEK